MSSFNPDTYFGYLSSTYSVPIDQVRFVTFLLLGYPFGALYRYGLDPRFTSVTIRHVATTCTGVLFGLLCFGWWQMFLLFLMTAVCFLMLHALPSTTVHTYTLVFAMACVSVGHVYRMITDYEGWSLDFSMPLMVMVQRVTLTAFDLHDGVHKGSEDKQHEIVKPPSLLEYWSYNYNFHTFLAGPACTMKEYRNFMDGSNQRLSAEKSESERAYIQQYPVLGTFLQSTLFVALHLVINSKYPVSSLLSPDYYLPTRILLAHIVMFQIRARYYFGWLLTESINNFVGLGLRGYDRQGNAVWGMCKNARVWTIEFGTNFREIITAWNIRTSDWIRKICYNRVPSQWASLAAFFLSAVWHGFYPGYYFCFISGAFMQTASMKLRRLLRHHFTRWNNIYDIITWTVSHLCIDFGVTCIHLLSFEKSLQFWKLYYFFPIILIVLASLIPVQGSKDKGKTKE